MSNLTKNRYPDFAARMREALEDSGLTRTDLAKALGVNKSTITHYCDGSSCPRSDMLKTLADLLHVRPSWLSGLGNSKHPAPRFLKDTRLFYPVFETSTPASNVILSGPDRLTLAESSDSQDPAFTMAEQPFDDGFVAADDSMSGAFIFKNDLVFLLSNAELKDLDIVAAEADGEPLLRRYHVLEDGSVQLIPANEAYETLTIPKNECAARLRILGKAVTVQHML